MNKDIYIQTLQEMILYNEALQASNNTKIINALYQELEKIEGATYN